MTIQIKEAIIKKVNSLQFWGLTLTLHIKAEDYTREDRDNLEQLWSDWTSVAVVMKEFWEKVEDKTPKLRQILALKMNEYSKVSWKDIWTIEKELYTRLNVNSRTELNEKQLQEQIEYYDLWIQELQIPFN